MRARWLKRHVVAGNGGLKGSASFAANAGDATRLSSRVPDHSQRSSVSVPGAVIAVGIHRVIVVQFDDFLEFDRLDV